MTDKVKEVAGAARTDFGAVVLPRCFANGCKQKKWISCLARLANLVVTG